MSEAISLLKEIRFGGYEASLITTFNAYLPFYEDVVLRHLMASGVRHNVLMMDSSQASLAIDRHPPRSAGRLYTLTPIKVGAAFHPKIILLVGKKKGTLFVGSHNMTLSGFGFNREMTNLIRYSGTGDADAAALLGSAWQDVLHWVATQGNHLTGHVSEMIMKVQDFAPWLQQSGAKVASEEYRVLASRQDAPSLWQQLREFVGTEPVKHVVISGAFFDANLSFIEQVRDALAPKELTVGFDPATVQFPVEKKLPGVSFVNSSGLGVGENHGKHAGYLHAKSIFIQHENGTMVLAVGSANPSSPAWLAPNLTKNAEMMIARKDEAALQTAEALGLTSIPTMPPLTKDDWEVARQNWDGTGGIEKNDAVSKVIIAIQMENAIRFRFPDCAHPSFLDCELFSSPFASPEVKRALLLDDEYVLALEGVVVPPILIRFIVNGKSFTGLVQCVKQIEGLSRTSSQRKFNEALASLTTGMPDIAHFIDCIKDIISISDKVVMTKSLPGGGLKKKDSEAPKKITEGAELSIGIDELDQQNIKKKQRLRSSDDLGYLLDVLLYNLRDDHQTGLEAVLEERDAKGRSEEEQVDADDEDEVPPVFPPSDREQKTPGVEFGNCTSARDADRNPLDVCHQKVRSLVSIARKKLDALKLGNMDLPQFVVILAGVLSTLRLLRGFDGKVPWIGAGQTAVPIKELRALFDHIASVMYDGSYSIICLDNRHSNLADMDEFARLKGLIVWLACECGISFKKKKPLSESVDEQNKRYIENQLYVATAQLIAGDDVVISEVQQSIGQSSPLSIDWLKKIVSVDKFFLRAYSQPDLFHAGGNVNSGDFGFNPSIRHIGMRAISKRGSNNFSLSFHDNMKPRFIFPEINIRVIHFEQIYNA